ncbi:hypothetical protein SEA_LYMARA_50 [Arthrobacter phage Lymara]|uniref:Uncharacterized protein n=1 Tax=Arthrobacter phage Lymara TaxID=2599828 RepID=A0A5J6TVM7_9CAUD|nr:hypothetical protein HYQ01_gp050 [Arthrobacter phage Lymara]QFG14851.1 hypothetical protein SEA_LYMARA_50 [Arthrobacter phage Lymara]
MNEPTGPREEKPVWRDGGPHSVKGVAFQDQETGDAIKAAYLGAMENIRELMERREELTEKVTPMYGRTEYTLNYEACANLSDIEKVALAYGGIPPFGGSVRGIRVTVFND